MNQYPNGPVAASRQGGMMAGREGYPDASQMPEIDDTPVNPAEAPPDMQDINPVIDSLKTLQQFQAALEGKQDPRAQGVKDGILAIITAVGGAAGAAEPEAPAEGETPAETQAEGGQGEPGVPTPKGAMMRRMGRDMNQGKGSVPLI